jgi:hypothetical protein
MEEMAVKSSQVVSQRGLVRPNQLNSTSVRGRLDDVNKEAFLGDQLSIAMIADGNSRLI